MDEGNIDEFAFISVGCHGGTRGSFRVARSGGMKELVSQLIRVIRIESSSMVWVVERFLVVW